MLLRRFFMRRVFFVEPVEAASTAGEDAPSAPSEPLLAVDFVVRCARAAPPFRGPEHEPTLNLRVRGVLAVGFGLTALRISLTSCPCPPCIMASNRSTDWEASINFFRGAVE
jgi:hypothetical protein